MLQIHTLCGTWIWISCRTKSYSWKLKFILSGLFGMNILVPKSNIQIHTVCGRWIKNFFAFKTIFLKTLKFIRSVGCLTWIYFLEIIFLEMLKFLLPVDCLKFVFGPKNILENAQIYTICGLFVNNFFCLKNIFLPNSYSLGCLTRFEFCQNIFKLKMFKFILPVGYSTWICFASSIIVECSNGEKGGWFG